MNNFIVPPSPNWYNVQILSSASDNTLVYGSKNDIVIINPAVDGKPLHINFLSRAHNQKITSVDVNEQWGSPNKWAISSGEDNLIRLWDISKLCKISSHEAHKEQNDKIVGARFLTEDRVLSVADNGTMYIWHPSTRQHTKLNNIFLSKVNITCFSPCPHATYITAFGLKNGLIIVANLKRNGSLMYKLRGHTTDIINLSWCPVPLNIFPSKPNNFIKGTKDSLDHASNKDDTEDQINVLPSKEFGEVNFSLEESKVIEHNNVEEKKVDEEINLVQPKFKKQNPWVNLKFVDDDEVQEELPVRELRVTTDFLEECSSLKKEIEELHHQGGQRSDDEKLTVQDEESPENFIREKQSDNEKILLEDVESAENIIKDKQSEKEKLLVEDVESPENIIKDKPSDNEASHAEKVESSDSIIKNETPANSVECESSIIIQNEEKNESELLISADAQSSNENSKSKDEEIKCNETAISVCVEEEPRKEYLLASSGKDSTINIWRAGTDGRLQCFFRLPERKIYQSKNKKAKDTCWTIVKWLTPFSLLTATRKGELLQYTLPKPMDPKNQYKVIHNEHSNLIFTIAAHIPNLTIDNWLCKMNTSFWTFGHDMYLLNTTLESQTIHLASIETFCALIQCMSQSPLDPNRIALGLSNGAIKIWNVNDFDVKRFATINYTPKIYSKITCLSWHPTNELILAFCTEEGTIGLLNTNNFQKATWFKQSFSVTVYKIQWGPSFQNPEKICLYATGGGKFLCFDAAEHGAEPVNAKFSTDTTVYSFAWKLDYSMILIVDMSGKIIILNPDFSPRATYYQKKKIASAVWHPSSESCSKDSGNKSYWVAAALDNNVHILDFQEVVDQNGTLDIQNATKSVLTGHLGNIRTLAWSPFDEDRLVSAGEDGIAYVWNVATQEILASFHSQNFETIKYVIWSPVCEDSLICSVRNASLVKWSISDYAGALTEEILEKCKHHVKTDKKVFSIKEDESAAKVIKKMKKSLKHAILPCLNMANNDSAEEKVKFLSSILTWKEDNHNVVTNCSPNIMQLFGTKEEVIKMLSFNEQSHMDKGKYETGTMINFWKGDLHEKIQETIDQRRVTPLLISLAPSVSINLWQKACETYALQLEEISDSDPLEIATYYLACQNLEKAINCLCEREMFKEALALAKCRLPEDNVFVENILQKWAHFAAYCGGLETAAQCYIILGKYEEAVKVLFRRNEVEILKFALELAKKTDNSELVKAVEFRCNAFKVLKNVEENQSPHDVKEESVENIKNDIIGDRRNGEEEVKALNGLKNCAESLAETRIDDSVEKELDTIQNLKSNSSSNIEETDADIAKTVCLNGEYGFEMKVISSQIESVEEPNIEKDEPLSNGTLTEQSV